MSVHCENGRTQFKVFVDKDGTSPRIQSAVWRGQHTCVSDKPEDYFQESFDPGFLCGDREQAHGSGVIKNQLKVEHFGVLNAAFVSFKCYGFPHSVMQQATRHRDSSFLVTSFRYTGEKFIKLACGEYDVEDVFYVRPAGIYCDRAGKKAEWQESDRVRELEKCKCAAKEYKDLTARGFSFEHCREFLPVCHRQPFDIFGTVEAFWHLLDQRTKQDAEREIQILARLMFEEFKLIAPDFAKWYEKNRYGKARLAP